MNRARNVVPCIAEMHSVTLGQSLVETALVLPILLFTFLGFGEAAFLYAQRHQAQISADVLADIASKNTAGDWDALVADEMERSGCNGIASVTDAGSGRVRVTLTCEYTPVVTNGLWPGLRYSVQGESVQ
jgi:uncharacterized membrane protein